jgi:hypothetical protein
LVKFRRIGDTQSSNGRRLFESVIDCHGEQSLHGFFVTADRGYGNLALLEDIIQHGISAIFIMPEHLLACHPFVGKSFLNAGRFDAEADDLSDSDENLQNHADTQVQRADRDRPNNFVIDDSTRSGPLFFMVKSLSKET